MPDDRTGQELDAATLDCDLHTALTGEVVLGLAPCLPYHDGGGEHVETEPGLADETEPRPVVLRFCDCEDCIPEWDKPKVLGHSWACLEPVPRYSTDIAASAVLRDELLRRGYCLHRDTSRSGAVVTLHRLLNYQHARGEGDTEEEALAVAALAALRAVRAGE